MKTDSTVTSLCVIVAVFSCEWKTFVVRQGISCRPYNQITQFFISLALRKGTRWMEFPRVFIGIKRINTILNLEHSHQGYSARQDVFIVDYDVLWRGQTPRRHARSPRVYTTPNLFIIFTFRASQSVLTTPLNSVPWSLWRISGGPCSLWIVWRFSEDFQQIPSIGGVARTQIY